MNFLLPNRRPSLPTLIFGGIFLVYCIAFYLPIREMWFSPDWATDDSMQQIYPFYKVLYPQLFAGDLITRMMECYLAPLHYWLSWAITWITGDPIMMGHWVMLLQLLSALAFVFLAVRHAAGTFPALFACTWFLHTRHVVQRLTGGLPRGWSPTVLCAFLYFALSGNHYGVLATLLVGCLLHTPSTLIAALAYGLYLLWMVLRRETRTEYWPHFVRLLLCAPLCVILALSVVKMPEDIGTMATLERAQSMVEFQKPSGRFPFLPFASIRSQLETFGFQAFVGKFSSPVSAKVKKLIPEIVTGVLVVCALVAWRRRLQVIPPVVWMFGLSSLLVYQASRLLAFRLYVPDRHLQIPLAIFFIIGLSIAARRLLAPANSVPKEGSRWTQPETLRKALPGMGCFLVLAGLIYAGSGFGLEGAMNFNTWRTKRGEVWTWLRDNSHQSSVVAGHPTFIDPVMLFGQRQAYVTTETTHPFYDKFYEEMKRRTAISLRAHYARNWQEFLAIIADEKIDYFVFQRALFKPLKLRSTTFFPPFGDIVAEVSARGPSQFVYLSLPSKVHMASFPPLVFVDGYSKVVDVAKLRAEVGAQVSGGQ
jgi:hypothetical protein